MIGFCKKMAVIAALVGAVLGLCASANAGMVIQVSLVDSTNSANSFAVSSNDASAAAEGFTAAPGGINGTISLNYSSVSVTAADASMLSLFSNFTASVTGNSNQVTSGVLNNDSLSVGINTNDSITLTVTVTDTGYTNNAALGAPMLFTSTMSSDLNSSLGGTTTFQSWLDQNDNSFGGLTGGSSGQPGSAWQDNTPLAGVSTLGPAAGDNTKLSSLVANLNSPTLFSLSSQQVNTFSNASGGTFSADGVTKVLTPEPVSAAIWGLGLVGMAYAARRRKKAVAVA